MIASWKKASAASGGSLRFTVAESDETGTRVSVEIKYPSAGGRTAMEVLAERTGMLADRLTQVGNDRQHEAVKHSAVTGVGGCFGENKGSGVRAGETEKSLIEVWSTDSVGGDYKYKDAVDAHFRLAEAMHSKGALHVVFGHTSSVDVMVQTRGGRWFVVQTPKKAHDAVDEVIAKAEAVLADVEAGKVTELEGNVQIILLDGEKVDGQAQHVRENLGRIFN